METIVKNLNLEKQLNKINASPDHELMICDDEESLEDLPKKYVIRNHKMTKLMIKINSLINKIESETKTSVLNIGQKKRRIERYILVVERINNNLWHFQKVEHSLHHPDHHVKNSSPYDNPPSTDYITLLNISGGWLVVPFD